MFSKKILMILMFAALVFVMVDNNAYASTTITGTAAKCSGLASCVYSISGGSAATSAFVGGYVGQSPLLFSGGSVSFRLPGETTTTYASGVYRGQAVLSGYSSTAGTLYTVTGSFSAPDVNTGTIVTGSTSDVIGIKGHSGRGGGIYFTLVRGSISLTQTGTAPPPLTAPQNLQITTGDDAFVLSWSQPANTGGYPIVDYKIYRSTSSGTETYYALRGNVLSYVDLSVTPGVTYYYKVSAVNSAGQESPLSNEVSACLC